VHLKGSSSIGGLELRCGQRTDLRRRGAAACRSSPRGSEYSPGRLPAALQSSRDYIRSHSGPRRVETRPCLVPHRAAILSCIRSSWRLH